SNPLWKLMKASYQALNDTNPNSTKHCWLCYGIRPPFYEAVGISDRAKSMNDPNPKQCIWNNRPQKQKQGITMQHVTGKGRCVG
ncbi:ENV2 protein, partial [Chloropsis cyanopogon]|nr:ENV2 protein [Chloropsis cyanopogon]